MTLKHLWALLTSRKVGNVTVILFLMLCVYLFGYRHMRFFRIPSSSMEPALQRVDQIVTLAYPTYQRGDIVVLRDREEPGAYLVKRIVGVAGDQISAARGALYLNGEYVSEPYIMEPMFYQFLEPVTIPEGQVFLLGDNRNNSSDSHDNLATFAVSDIIGRALFIYYPFERWAPVRSYPLTNRLGQ